jgi:hypothetical protein
MGYFEGFFKGAKTFFYPLIVLGLANAPSSGLPTEKIVSRTFRISGTLIVNYVPLPYCSGSRKGSVRGPCEWGSHIGKGGAGSQRREQGASVEPKQGKREDVRRRQEDKDDDRRMVSRCQHAQRKLTCIAQEETSECVGEGVLVVLTVFIVSGK